MVEHVEKYVCPTITSDQILGGMPLPLQGRHAGRTSCFVIAEDEYQTEATLPEFASKHLVKDYRVSYVFDDPRRPRTTCPAIDVLTDADLAVRQRPPPGPAEGAARRRPQVRRRGQAGGRHPDGQPRLRAEGPDAGPEGPRRLDRVRPPRSSAATTRNHHRDGPTVAIAGLADRRRRTRSSTGVDVAEAASATARSTRSARWRRRPRRC